MRKGLEKKKYLPQFPVKKTKRLYCFNLIIMKALNYLLLISVFFLSTQCSGEKEKTNSVQENVTPESQGVSSQSILDFIKAAETERKDDLHSFILMRHGNIVAQGWWNPYNPESTHMLYSLSKSFTSTAIGLAQSEGLLSIYDPVISFFPDETPENPSDNLKSMRIKDLLRMNTGHESDMLGAIRSDTESWVQAFLTSEIEHKPGIHFVYNSMATFMLSAIIQKVTGQTLFDYLKPRLFDPLGFENSWWETNMNGINTGGWGLNVRTKDIANFGQMYLQKGMWNNEQIIPKDWVEEATKLQTSNGSDPKSDWEQGYGYQFWRCRHNIYRGDGAFGQYCIVMPELDAVLAITSGTSNMQAILELVWDHLLPGIKDAPIEENPTLVKALEDKLASLQLSTVAGEESTSKDVFGKTYKIEKNKFGITSVLLNKNDDKESITINYKDNSVDLPIGFGELKNSKCELGNFGEQELATSAGWISDTLRLRSYLYETPSYINLDLVFSENKLKITGRPNVWFGALIIDEMVGYME